MKHLFSTLAIAAVSTLTFVQPAAALEVRTCGAALHSVALHSVPLSDERDFQSALVQAFAVVNTESEPVTLTGVHFQLKAGGQVTDTRWLRANDVARAAKQGPQIWGLAQLFPSQFCNGEMLKGSASAKSEESMK